jgi:hypothetical protein
MNYIAIQGETPRPLDDLRYLLPNISFPEDELTSTSDLAAFIALAGYEACTVTNTEASVTLAWNQIAQLGTASRVAGALVAAWAPVAISADAQLTKLADERSIKSSASAAATDAVYDAPQTFATGTGQNDPAVYMRPNSDTIDSLSQLLLLAVVDTLANPQNAAALITIIDAAGTSVPLTQTQLRTLVAALIDKKAEVISLRTALRADLTTSRTPDVTVAALDSFNNEILKTSFQTISGFDMQTRDNQPLLQKQLYSASSSLPSTPTGLTSTAGNNQILLSWTAANAPAQVPIVDYLVQYSSNNGTTWQLFDDSIGAGTTATVTGLTNGATYIFRVAAVNAIGVGAYSPATAPIAPVAPLTAPTNLIATPGNQQLQLTWTAPTSTGGGTITEYRLRYTPAGGSQQTVNTSTTATSYTLTGLTNGTAYTIDVAAVLSSVVSSYSSAATGTPDVVPNAPTGLSATAAVLSALLSWSAPTSNGGTEVTEYAVEYSSNGGTSWTALSADSLIGTTISGLTANISYSFRVAAVNDLGAGPWATTSATPLPPVITITSQPANQTAASGAATFSVAATVTGNATLSYQWQKQESGSGSFTNVGGATSSTLALSGLTNADDNGDVYRVVVSATGGATSVTSNSATVTVAAELSNYAVTISGSTTHPVAGTYLLWGTLNAKPYWLRIVNGAPNGYIYSIPDNNGTWLVGPTLGNGSGTQQNAWYYTYNNGDKNTPPLSGWAPQNYGGDVALTSAALGSATTAAAPTNLVAVATSLTTVALTWTMPTDNGNSVITGYRIEYTPAGGSAQTINTSTTATSYELTDLTTSTAYSIRVATLNAIGASSYSDAASATPYYPIYSATVVLGPPGQPPSGRYVYSEIYNGKPVWTHYTDGTPSGRINWSTLGYWRAGPSISNDISDSWFRKYNDGDYPPLTGWDAHYWGGSFELSYAAPLPVIAITSQPSNQTASGGSAAFSVSATVTQNATLSYQWQKQESGAGAFSNVSGATSSSLALSGLTNADDNGDVYRVVVSATLGAESVTSSNATLTA